MNRVWEEVGSGGISIASYAHRLDVQVNLDTGFLSILCDGYWFTNRNFASQSCRCGGHQYVENQGVRCDSASKSSGGWLRHDVRKFPGFAVTPLAGDGQAGESHGGV